MSSSPVTRGLSSPSFLSFILGGEFFVGRSHLVARAYIQDAHARRGRRTDDTIRYDTTAPQLRDGARISPCARRVNDDDDDRAEERKRVSFPHLNLIPDSCAEEERARTKTRRR